MAGLCFSSTTIVNVTVGLTTLPLIPHNPAKFSIFVLPFDFVLIFMLFLFVDCFGYLTLYNCIHVYTAGGDMTLIPSLCWGVLIWSFSLRLDVIFFTD